MTESGENAVRAKVEVIAADHADALEVFPTIAEAQAAPPNRGLANDLGPVLQYVLPGTFAITFLVRSILDLVRRSGRGRVISLNGEQVTVAYSDGIPRGVLVVRKDGATVGVYDLAKQAEPLPDIIEKLKGES